MRPSPSGEKLGKLCSFFRPTLVAEQLANGILHLSDGFFALIGENQRPILQVGNGFFGNGLQHR